MNVYRENKDAIVTTAESRDLLVFSILREPRCSECNKELWKGDFLFKEGERGLCLNCADRGDAALTRRASKYSPLWAVVVRFSRARKRYERQGILVFEAALDQAEEECLADSELRALRRERDAERRAEQDQSLVAEMAREISRLFPGCPPAEARTIAEHTARRGSGRVGRTAAGRSLEEAALTLAVVANIRHSKTKFPLLGAHRATACIDCHKPPNLETKLMNVDFKVAPTQCGERSRAAWNACTTCHEDQHKGRLGPNCLQCHNFVDWKTINLSQSGQSQFDHSKTRYPLTGLHAQVQCAKCHINGPDGKPRYVGIPFNLWEVFPVVLRVAAGAFLAGARGNVIGGVQAFVSRKPRRDFSVTGKTLQRRLTAKLMATGAFGGSVQRLVRSREWSRGDLCGSRAAQTYRETHQSEQRGDAERKADRPGPAPVLCHCVFWHYSLRFACKHGSDFAL